MSNLRETIEKVGAQEVLDWLKDEYQPIEWPHEFDEDHKSLHRYEPPDLLEQFENIKSEDFKHVLFLAAMVLTERGYIATEGKLLDAAKTLNVEAVLREKGVYIETIIGNS